MSDLSIFIDESGDFGDYEAHCPFYIITMVFHDQSKPIDHEVNELKRHVLEQGLPSDHAIHTAPLVRREKEYRDMDWAPRRKLFRSIFDFVRFADIKYHAFVVKRKEFPDSASLLKQMSHMVNSFVEENLGWLSEYERIVVYYDNGQKEISRLIRAALSKDLNAETVQAYPEDYCLLQAADLFCTLELARMKLDERNYGLSRSELEFFSSQRFLKKSYLKPLDKKRL